MYFFVSGAYCIFCIQGILITSDKIEMHHANVLHSFHVIRHMFMAFTIQLYIKMFMNTETQFDMKSVYIENHVKKIESI